MATSLFGEMNPQPAFDFPQSLTEKYRPLAIADFVGLEKPKKIMQKLAGNPFPSAWLFVGPSGTGKTTMGLALAAAIPAELHHIPSQDCNLENIERVRRICQYVPMALADPFQCATDRGDARPCWQEPEPCLRISPLR